MVRVEHQGGVLEVRQGQAVVTMPGSGCATAPRKARAPNTWRSACRPSRPTPSTATSSPPASRSAHHPSRAGARLHYDRAGSGPPLLLVQGVGIIGRGWQPQVDGLRDRFTVITFDNRGIGASTAGTGPLSIEVMARDALAIIDAEGLTRFHLAGHSMGGVIAQQIALAAPERVISLALLCTFPRGARSHAPDVGGARCRTPHPHRNADA